MSVLYVLMLASYLYKEMFYINNVSVCFVYRNSCKLALCSKSINEIHKFSRTSRQP